MANRSIGPDGMAGTLDDLGGEVSLDGTQANSGPRRREFRRTDEHSLVHRISTSVMTNASQMASRQCQYIAV